MYGVHSAAGPGLHRGMHAPTCASCGWLLLLSSVVLLCRSGCSTQTFTERKQAPNVFVKTVDFDDPVLACWRDALMIPNSRRWETYHTSLRASNLGGSLIKKKTPLSRVDLF